MAASDTFQMPERTPPGFESQLGRIGNTTRVPNYKPGPGIGEPQHRMVNWLAKRGGSGVLTKTRCGVIAQGDELLVAKHASKAAPYWERGVATGLIGIEGSRVLITEKGLDYVKRYPANPTTKELLEMRDRETRPSGIPSVEEY